MRGAADEWDAAEDWDEDSDDDPDLDDDSGRYGYSNTLVWGWTEDLYRGHGSAWGYEHDPEREDTLVVRLGWDEGLCERLQVGGRGDWRHVWAADRRVPYPSDALAEERHLRVARRQPPLYPPDCLVETAAVGFLEDLIGILSPHSEADPIALLIQFLTAFGSLVGRRAYFVAERDRHYPNLFAVLVGETAKGRKGASWGQAVQVLQGLCPQADEWLANHVSSGLSSGEGLIHVLRDIDLDQTGEDAGEPEPGTTDHKRKESARAARKAATPETPSALQRDKRLLVRESEFAAVLKMFLREGNTLSAVLRQAWDGDTLGVITKHSSERASKTHIAVVGHITRDELLRNLSQTEAANGLGNRFLWFCTRRSKLLPHGGSLEEAELEPLRKWLRWVIEWLDTLHDAPLARDEEAEDMWSYVYASLSEGQPGLAGALTARAEAQVMRIASIYALLHHSLVIDVRCLGAALAVWEYAEHSVRHIFGDTLGDAIADTILRALRETPAGLTRSDLGQVFGKNLGVAHIERALAGLAQRGLVLAEREETGGRPSQRWFAVSRRNP